MKSISAPLIIASKQTVEDQEFLTDRRDSKLDDCLTFEDNIEPEKTQTGVIKQFQESDRKAGKRI